jgi:uncharacterized protein YaiE (UPF0345 family)
VTIGVMTSSVSTFTTAKPLPMMWVAAPPKNPRIMPA